MRSQKLKVCEYKINFFSPFSLLFDNSENFLCHDCEYLSGWTLIADSMEIRINIYIYEKYYN